MEILWIILGIIVFILVMGLLVMVHEAGHFLVAKKAGILCHEFSIGMGPLIYQKKKGETLYSVRLFPIGGYVSMAGEEVEDNILKGIKKVKLVINDDREVEKIIVNLDNPKYTDLPIVEIESYDLIGTSKALDDELYIEVLDGEQKIKYIVKRDCLINFEKKAEIQIAPYDRNFVNKPWLNRFLSVLAGPLMNIVLAIVIFFLIGLFSGYAKTNDTVIGEVTEVEGSGNIQLEEGDKLTSINGIKLTDWQSISDALSQIDLSKTPKIVVGIEGKEDIVINPSVFVYSIELAFKVDGTDLPIVGHYSASNEKTKSYKAGLRDGDTITKIETANKVLSQNVTKSSILEFFNSSDLEEGQNVTITYLCDGNEYKTDIEVYSKKLLNTQNISATKIQLGITCANGFDLGKLLYMPFVQTGESFTMIFKTLGAIFTDKSVGVDDLSGPVGIFNLLKEATKDGFLTILNWTAILSVNLGFMNIIPLPALDGGRIAFMLYEGVTRKKPNAKVENIIHTIGFLLLMALMIFISFNDVLRCVGCK